MTTIGKVCLWLTVIGLGVISVWLLPTVGKKHNDVSTALRKAQESVDAAVEDHRRNDQDLRKKKNQLARLQIGWDKSWDISRSATAGVEIQGPQLTVLGLGLETGLEPVLDAAGQEAPPAVHAFKMMPEGGMFYVGEFQAAVLDATSSTLVPTWQVTPEEVDVWVSNAELPWRFRTLVPAGKRLHVDQLHGQLQRLSEDYARTEANVVQQQALLEEAERQLEIRNQELLGNPDADPVPGRPEHVDGLLPTISTEEERRNDLQVMVDSLRRQIKAASEERDELVRRLKEYPDRLPSADDGGVAQSAAQVQ